jgi:anthranilate phosphoribosyltransferase
MAGLPRHPSAAIRGGDASTNTAILLQVLEGHPSAHADLTALNAGAALMLAGRATGLRQGVVLARELLASGAARQLLESYRQASALRRAA